MKKDKIDLLSCLVQLTFGLFHLSAMYLFKQTTDIDKKKLVFFSLSLSVARKHEPLYKQCDHKS